MERTIFIDGEKFFVPDNANVIMVKSNHGNHSGYNKKFEIVDVYKTKDKAYNDAFMYFLTFSDSFVVKDNSIVDETTNEEVYEYGSEAFEYDLYYYYIDYIENGCFLENYLMNTGTPLSSLMENSVYFEKIDSE